MKKLSPAPHRETSVPLSANWLKNVRRRLLDWFEGAQRPLPWRSTRDPYAIWLSEIMLQQTTVATVTPAYRRFLIAFPTLADLAAASESQVLRAWEGLGYYRRARQLHSAAQILMRDHQGIFPRDPRQILALPGIGRYTAGAIASIAFDLPEPILEANTYRVWARLLGETRPVRHTATQARLWEAAAKIHSSRKTGAGQLNQALMELGSQICLPKVPGCLICPVQSLCAAYQSGQVAQIPAAEAGTNWTLRHEGAVIVSEERGLLMTQYADGVRWAGLWDVPRVVFSTGESIPTEIAVPWEKPWTNTLKKILATKVPGRWRIGPWFRRFKHTVTRYKITLDVWQANWRGKTSLGPKSFDPREYRDVRWVPLDQLAGLPLSTTGRKIVNEYLGEN
ncbi:MAG: A/G-specific adenine glycosylase [Pirellulales bacterium]|nr:A/G-specific adenine glycosylase [Pirellulales bacterium]